MDRVRIAIVGCGNVSQLNVPGYLRHPKCEVYALCDNVPGRAELRAREWGISPRVYTDPDQVLNDLADDYYETYVERVMEVTAEDVRRVAVEYLDPDEMVVVIAGDRAAIQEGLEGLGLGSVTLLTDPTVMDDAP